jgi:hypothetical protein
VKKPLRVALWVVGSIVVVLECLQLFGMWTLSHAGYVFPDHDLPSHLIGRWDWSTRARPCGDSAELIAFSPDHRTMTISRPAHLADTGWTATYDVSIVTPSRVRGAIRGEKRLTENGVPVVWDLVLFKADEYRWHRADWKPWGYTPRMIRCDAEAQDTI